MHASVSKIKKMLVMNQDGTAKTYASSLVGD
jgi:hypothetical protein